MTTATTHYLNNVNHHNNGGSNGSGAGGGNVVLNAGGIVLTGAAAVVTSSNNSRSNSPVPPSVNPPQTNTFFNINNTNTSSNNNTTSNQSKPPLFLSTLGNQNYVDSNLAGGGGGGTGGINSGDGVGSIIRPKPSMSLSRPDSAALSSVSEANTPVNNNSTSVISPRGFSGGGSSGSSGDSVDAAMFPSIRSHTPSPVPTPNGASAAGHAGHGGNNSNYAPLFSQSASPGKPLPKGMILSNSMENFASFGVNKDDHAAHSKSMPSVVLGAAGGGGGGASGSVDGKATNYNTSFTAAPVPGVSGGTSASSDSRNHQSSHQGSHQQQQQSLFQPGAQRKGSTDSLSIATEGNLLVRATPPSSGGPKSPSPKTAATGPAAGAAGAAGFGSLARAGSFSFDTVSSGDSLGTPPSASGSAKNKKKAQRPSLAEQLAHIHLNGQSSSAAKTTDELDTPKTATSNSVGNTPKGSGGGQQESFFSQSLNSAIAIGRSVVSGIGVHRTSSSSPTADLFDVEDRSTQSGSSGGGGGGGAQNTGVHALFSVPVRAFSVGSCNCKSPGRVVFFANRCEYPFHHPHDSSVVVNLSLQYADMTAVTTVGTKLRFKISRRSAQALGEIDALNSFHLVTLELTSTASMTNVREKVVPLINQAR